MPVRACKSEHRIRASKYTNTTRHRRNQFEITPVCPHKQREVGATLTGDKTSAFKQANSSTQ